MRRQFEWSMGRSSKRWSRWAMGLATALLLGGVYQAGCIGFASDQVQRSIDFCFLFDCQNGALGGLVRFCPDDLSDSTSDNFVVGANTFVDCPNTQTN